MVIPNFVRKGARRSSAFRDGTVISSSCGEAVDIGWWAVGNVNPSSVGCPSVDSRFEMIVGVGNAPVVLFLEFVKSCARVGVAPTPELFDKIFLFLGAGKLFKNRFLLSANNVNDMFIEPFLILVFPLFLSLGKRIDKEHNKVH